VNTILASARFRSFYIVGSYARGEQKPDSDIDVLLIMQSPIIIPRFIGLRQVYRLRKYKLSATFFGACALRGVEKGRSSPFVPLLWNWRRDAVLVAGKDLLPEPRLSIDSSSFAVYACRSIRWFLWGLRMGDFGLDIESGTRRWLLKASDRLIEDSAVISGVPSMWGQVWSEIKKEAMKAEPDPKRMCVLLADTLESIKPLFRFTRLHQTTYVLVAFASHRRILWRTMFRKVPIQTRFVEAMILLMKGASKTEPDILLIGEAAKQIEDFTDVSHIENTRAVWTKLRDAVCANLDDVMFFDFAQL